jgi:hypothetical protein
MLIRCYSGLIDFISLPLLCHVSGLIELRSDGVYTFNSLFTLFSGIP